GWNRKLRSETPLEKREGDDQAECPESDEQDQREGAEHREHVFPPVPLGDSLRGSSPGRPQEPVEGPRRPESSRDATGEDDRLERIPQDDEGEERADGGSPRVHGARITTRRGFAERACRFSLTASITCATASSSTCPTAVAMDAGSPIMGGSTAEGIEEDREDRVDDHDGEEARHHRRDRRPTPSAPPRAATPRWHAMSAMLSPKNMVLRHPEKTSQSHTACCVSMRYALAVKSSPSIATRSPPTIPITSARIVSRPRIRA